MLGNGYWYHASIPMWILYAMWLLSLVHTVRHTAYHQRIRVISLVLVPMVVGLLFTTQVRTRPRSPLLDRMGLTPAGATRSCWCWCTTR